MMKEHGTLDIRKLEKDMYLEKKYELPAGKIVPYDTDIDVEPTYIIINKG